MTSPISGTVVSVDIAQGDTVSADSSTDVITIIGTKSYEVQGTLDSSQVPSVKVGQTATVEVDGVNGSLQGTVAQVGPVQSSDGEYTYPVVVSLPSDSQGLFTGSTANVVIDTGSVSNVVAVPTSAVETTGNRSYVLLIDKGILTRKVVKIGMIGDTYTQIVSGLKDGQSVVLADYAEAVPSSNTDLTTALGGGATGFGGFGGFGGGAGGFGGGAGGFTRVRRRRCGGLRRLSHRRRVGGHTRRHPRCSAQRRTRQRLTLRWPRGADPAGPGEPRRQDVEASRAFYARLGLDFGDEPDPVWAAHHVSARHGENAPTVDLDLDSVTFAAKWNEGWPGGAGAVLGFKVDTRARGRRARGGSGRHWGPRAAAPVRRLLGRPLRRRERP